jgi:cytochrome c oxidase subunit 2
MTIRTPIRFVALATAAIVAFTACGGDSDVPALGPDAEIGRQVYRGNGCASCHGANGQGGVGPELAGLWGESVELDDGTTVTATPEYLRTSILDPRTQIVAGYQLPMPANSLTDDEVDSILAFIEAMGPATEPDR